jgi:DNA topoisomerase-1
LSEKRAMAKNLVIVESCKGENDREISGSDFQVESSYGHIADLPSRDRVDVENGFKPKYEVSSDKKALFSKLKALAKKLKWFG